MEQFYHDQCNEAEKGRDGALFNRQGTHARSCREAILFDLVPMVQESDRNGKRLPHPRESPTTRAPPRDAQCSDSDVHNRQVSRQQAFHGRCWRPTQEPQA